jgi:hypothetical protein
VLGAAQKVHEKYGKNPVIGSYMMLVGYFNSLRDFGGMRRLSRTTYPRGSPEPRKAVWSAGSPRLLDRDLLRGKIGQGRIQRLDLDDEVVDAGAEVDCAPGRVVHQLDGDEAGARQPEHSQAAERRPFDGPDDRVPTAV